LERRRAEQPIDDPREPLVLLQQDPQEAPALVVAEVGAVEQDLGEGADGVRGVFSSCSTCS
jgi:hypothetical protein